MLEYRVSGDKLEVVDIPTGYVHNIENVGQGELVTIMWASELFDPQNPDTWQSRCRAGVKQLSLFIF